MSRNPIDQMRGYFYQYDYSIRIALELPHEDLTVTIEGIEDLDFDNGNERTAVQCKYHEKSEYIHSLIGKPIRLMLKHFQQTRRNGGTAVRYKLYGHYQNGHHKFPANVDSRFVKSQFLTYTSDKIQYIETDVLGVSEAELEEFVASLDIDIHALSYDASHRQVQTLLQSHFRCGADEADYILYNAALRVVRDLAIAEDGARTITKREFLARVDRRDLLLDSWFLATRKRKKFLDHLRSQWFSNGLNTVEMDRIFVIELLGDALQEIKSLILTICRKWSKISLKEPHGFCPYFCLPGADEALLKCLKTELSTEGHRPVDGYDYLHADFAVKSLLQRPTVANEIKVKFINELEQVPLVLRAATRTRIVYQFYRSDLLLANSAIEGCGASHRSLRVETISDIKELLK